ncbi:MAG: acyl-CoA dehydrogenase family protein [Candidatus Binatia bacterium]|nr:acyl-CoA dehydrogenase family protein [Candidatus Binatia bacterium]
MDWNIGTTERMIRDTFRDYFLQHLEPLVPPMERGEELPYPFMRRMHRELGLDAFLSRRAESTATEHSPLNDFGLDERVLKFARITFSVEMARVSPSFALSYGASVGLFGANVAARGTPEQVERFALPVLRCERIGCWCLTEPQAGSDALGGMRTRARFDGDTYVLTGSKTFITNAPYADLFLVYARVQGGPLDGSIQPFIVERGTPGLATGAPMRKMGMHGSPTGEVFLDEVRIPATHLLGGGVRQRDHVKSSLAQERLGLAALSYGIAERCFEIARDYAKQRHQFGQPIANFQLVQQRLARMYVALSNARRFVYADYYSDRPLAESLAEICAGKLYCAEVGTFVAFEAIHILGGYGYIEDYTVERLARDAKLIELGGGTTEMQILTIAREILR